MHIFRLIRDNDPVRVWHMSVIIQAPSQLGETCGGIGNVYYSTDNVDI